MSNRKQPTRHAATAPFAGILIDFDTVAMRGDACCTTCCTTFCKSGRPV
jgi:hypothetical protein